MRIFHQQAGEWYGKAKCGAKGHWGRSGVMTTQDPNQVECKKCRGEVKRRITKSVTKNLLGKIVVIGWGYSMRIIDYYVIVKQTPKTIIVKEIGSQEIESTGYLSGKVMPDNRVMGDKEIRMGIEEDRDGSIIVKYHRSGNYNQYGSIWDGLPREYNHCD